MAVFFWILPGLLSLVVGQEARPVAWLHGHLPEGVIALMAAVVLFALPAGGPNRERTLTWADAARIDWGTILLFGGGMALGQMMFDTKLAQWIGESLAFALPSRSVFWLTLLFAALAALVSETTSNTASAAMMIPLSIAVAQSAGVDPMKPALAACLGSSLGFMLPVSTPPNALAYGTGAVPLMAMVRHGLWLDLAGCVLVVASVTALAP
jgi:sodium-dependent dicarboxylate transporter 2/3/5